MSQHGPSVNFRDFVTHLAETGDLVDIARPVDANLEAGAITRRVYETRSPAPLFSAIRSAEPGFRLLGAPAGMSRAPGREHGRLAAHFGLPATAGPREIVEHLIAARQRSPIPPKRVKSGPCKENVWRGDEVDLTRFPVPLLHAEDGGRYFGTYGFHVVRTPDRRWTSWSVARTMLVDRTRLTGPAMPQQHIGMIRQEWADRGEPTPWAMVLGAPPAALAAAGMPLPAEVNEDGYVGALTGNPVEVVRTELHDLDVPANAEIVLEGYLSADETAPEGPMGEYHGYSFPESKPQPVFHVEAVTFRDNPILPICAAGIPPEENHTIWGTMISAEALQTLREADVPVDFAWCSYEAATCWIVVSLDPARVSTMDLTEADLVHRVADALFSSHAGWLVPKVILVGNDIDITDINQVVWAMATRHHPVTGHYPFPDAPGILMVPYLTDDDKNHGSGGKSILSCLLPGQLDGTYTGTPASFATSYPAELQQSVLQAWTDYGFPAP